MEILLCLRLPQLPSWFHITGRQGWECWRWRSGISQSFLFLFLLHWSLSPIIIEFLFSVFLSQMLLMIQKLLKPMRKIFHKRNTTLSVLLPGRNWFHTVWLSLLFILFLSAQTFILLHWWLVVQCFPPLSMTSTLSLRIQTESERVEFCFVFSNFKKSVFIQPLRS